MVSLARRQLQTLFLPVHATGVTAPTDHRSCNGPDRVLSQRDAWAVYDRWTEDPRISLVGESPSLEPEFRSLSRLNRPAPKDWADSYLLAFAKSSDLTLVYFRPGIRTQAPARYRVRDSRVNSAACRCQRTDFDAQIAERTRLSETEHAQK